MTSGSFVQKWFSVACVLFFFPKVLLSCMFVQQNTFCCSSLYLFFQWIPFPCDLTSSYCSSATTCPYILWCCIKELPHYFSAMCISSICQGLFDSNVFVLSEGKKNPTNPLELSMGTINNVKKKQKQKGEQHTERNALLLWHQWGNKALEMSSVFFPGWLHALNRQSHGMRWAVAGSTRDVKAPGCPPLGTSTGPYRTKVTLSKHVDGWEVCTSP